METYLALEWHEPHFNFATMTRKPGSWAVKAMVYTVDGWTFDPTSGGIMLRLDDYDAKDLFRSGSLSVRDVLLRSDQIAARHPATAQDPAWAREIGVIDTQLERGELTAAKTVLALAERARLCRNIDLADAYAIAAE